jgi:hypothetical protein
MRQGCNVLVKTFQFGTAGGEKRFPKRSQGNKLAGLQVGFILENSSCSKKDKS